ncbi:hypothetical protein D3C71_78720 [compost metagenome]
MVGDRTEAQAFMIALLFQMLGQITHALGTTIPESTSPAPGIHEYVTPRLTLRFIEEPGELLVEEVGFPWNDVKTLKQQLYQQWYYWADCGQPFDYGDAEADVIKTLAIAKRFLTVLQPKVTMQRRSDHFVTIMLWPIVDGGDHYRAELSFS